MGKYRIQIETKKCTGCLRCRLACSYQYSKKFNPSVAGIRVMTSDKDYAIMFSDDCNMCGICADNCFFDALVKSKQETLP